MDRVKSFAVIQTEPLAPLMKAIQQSAKVRDYKE
jgi:hypothetical protein